MSSKIRVSPKKFKIQRRLMTELPGLGKAGALERRPYPPGEHGNKRKKFSEYALQLEEKQKIKFNYDLREEQLLRFIKEAKRIAQANWVDALVGLLERRLDNVVFRLGFAPSIRAARQLVSHRKVLVNGKIANIGSLVLDVGDRVELKPKAYENQVYLSAIESPRLPLASYLKLEKQTVGHTGMVSEVPNLSHLPFAFEPGLFVSYYSL